MKSQHISYQTSPSRRSVPSFIRNTCIMGFTPSALHADVMSVVSLKSLQLCVLNTLLERERERVSALAARLIQLAQQDSRLSSSDRTHAVFTVSVSPFSVKCFFCFSPSPFLLLFFLIYFFTSRCRL